MKDSQVGIAVAAIAIVAVAVALYRQGALGRLPLVVALAAALGLAGFLVATL